MFGLNLTLIASLISAGIAGAAGFGLAWQLRTGTITSMELDNANTRISQQRAARESIERSTTALAIAQRNAVNRGITDRAAAADSRDALDGLRAQSAAALRAAASSLDACLVTTHAFSVISDQCSTEYTTLARDAQGHLNDVKTLTEIWPK